MKLGLILHDPEEEQDCFSDNTHNSHYYDQVGMMNLWRGRYKRTDGRVVQGGSTITQQVAKNLFLTNARTFRRKVQELLLTLWLEHSFTKREILEIWLNRVYLGSGTWGVDAVLARRYLGWRLG